MEVRYSSWASACMDYFTGVVQDEAGDIAWFRNGTFHREDGPAVIYKYLQSPKEWWWEGQQMAAMELFDKLSDEQKGKVIWELNEWK